MNTPQPPKPQLPIFGLIFVSMFGFVGLTVLIFVWSQPEGEPPLFFRFFASFIAIGFMAFGFGPPISALMQRVNGGEDPFSNQDSPPAEPPRKGYTCPNCGAGLGQQEVSPSGDVKCTYCQKWWNIHRTVE